MKQSFTKLFSLGLLLLTFNQMNAANFTFSNASATGGNWNVAANWTRDSGTDPDGIPDADDNVTIPAGRLCILTAAASCTNLELLPSATPRLDLRANLEIKGTLFGSAFPGTYVAPIKSTPVGAQAFFTLNFTGTTSRTVVDSWDAYPVPSSVNGFNVTFTGSSLLTVYTINGNFGCKDLFVTTCNLTTPNFLFIGHNTTGAATLATTGQVTVNGNSQLTVSQNLGFRGAGLTTYCNQIDVRGTLEVKGNIAIAANIIAISQKLRIAGSNTAGIVNTSGTSISWGQAGAIEYASSTNVTVGDEIKFSSSIVTDPKDLIPIPTIVLNMPSSSLFVFCDRISSIGTELSLISGIFYLNSTMYLGQSAEVTGYGTSSYVRYSTDAAKIRKQITTAGNYFFPIGTNNRYTPIEFDLTAVGNTAGFEEIVVAAKTTTPSCLTSGSIAKSYQVYYNITTTYPGTTGTFKLHYGQNTPNTTSRGASYIPSSAGIVRCVTGSPRRTMSTTAGEVTDNANFTYYVAGNYQSNSGDYILTSDASILPITLRNFKGKIQDETALLSWNTEGALNFSHFDIEHSTDGLNWQSVGRRDYYKQINQYQIEHSNMVSGVNYYRLKQVDLDGSFEYSRVINLNLQDGRIIISVRPNVVSDQTLVVINTQKTSAITLNLVNSIGKIVESKQINAERGIQEIPFDLSQKPNGIYLISAFEGSTLLQNVKLLKAQ